MTENRSEELGSFPLCAWNVKGKCIKETPYRHVYCDTPDNRRSCKNFLNSSHYTVIWTQSKKPIKEY